MYFYIIEKSECIFLHRGIIIITSLVKGAGHFFHVCESLFVHSGGRSIQTLYLCKSNDSLYTVWYLSPVVPNLGVGPDPFFKKFRKFI